MPTDGRTYIRVHDGMPDHPKVDALSDRAFRVLVESWCWCSRHLTDGLIPRATWTKRGTPRARRELLEAGLIEDLGPDGVRMHDYLDHQRSKAEVEEITAARREASRKANHTRWHTGRNGRRDPGCSLCAGSGPDPKTDPATDSDPHPNTDSGIGSGSIPIGIGRGIDREVVTSGGEGPEADARDENAPTPIYDPDNPRCAHHSHIQPGEPVPACRACADVRRTAQQHLVDSELNERARREAWRAEVDACTECDENGKLQLPDGRLIRHHDWQALRAVVS